MRSSSNNGSNSDGVVGDGNGNFHDEDLCAGGNSNNPNNNNQGVLAHWAILKVSSEDDPRTPRDL